MCAAIGLFRGDGGDRVRVVQYAVFGFLGRIG